MDKLLKKIALTLPTLAVALFGVSAITVVGCAEEEPDTAAEVAEERTDELEEQADDLVD